MNRVHTFFARDIHDAGNIQIGFDGAFARAHLVGFIRFEPVQAEAIFLRVDRHGAQAQFVRCAKNAYGDFAAVRCEQFFDRAFFGI